MPYSIDLKGKNALVMGVASHRSIAWAIAQRLREAGARLVFTYQNERLKENVAKLMAGMQDVLLLPCDVSKEEEIKTLFDTLGQQLSTLSILIHSIAFAPREELEGDFSKTNREGFRAALDVSAYSLVPVARRSIPLMEKEGGSILTLTFQASERVFPGYNVMGTAKAALENIVRQLAAELGGKNIRVNAISAGPLDTLAARGIHGFVDMKRIWEQRAPLRRNITHDEVAKTALFLCSDMASGVTGAVIPVDAGYNIMGL